MCSGALSQRGGVVVVGAELDEMHVRLLEMPAERLFVFGRVVAGAFGEPVGVALVQFGARALEEAPVRGVADQRMMETKHWVAEKPRAIGLDQLGPAQG